MMPSQDKQNQIIDFLQTVSVPVPISEILKIIPMRKQDCLNFLYVLVENGQAQRLGKGVKGNPARFIMNTTKEAPDSVPVVVDEVLI